MSRTPATHTRAVTINGETHHIPASPKIPADWDLIVLRGVATVVAVTTAIGIALTTEAVGGLLSPLATTGVAYAAAAVIDVIWLTALALEYLGRYDRGWGASLVSWAGALIGVVAIIIRSNDLGVPAAGAVGGVITLGSKISWALLLRRIVHRLDPDSLAWLRAHRARRAFDRAMAIELRSAARDRARTRALLEAIEGPAPHVHTAPPPQAHDAPAHPHTAPVREAPPAHTLPVHAAPVHVMPVHTAPVHEVIAHTPPPGHTPAPTHDVPPPAHTTPVHTAPPATHTPAQTAPAPADLPQPAPAPPTAEATNRNAIIAAHIARHGDRPATAELAVALGVDRSHASRLRTAYVGKLRQAEAGRAAVEQSATG